MKQTNLLISASFLVMAVSTAQAAVTWGDFGYQYLVQENGATVYANDADVTNGGTEIEPPSLPDLSKERGSSGGAITTKADSILTDSTFGLTQRTGATGDLSADGIKVKAWQETSTDQNNGVPSPFGIQSIGTKNMDIIAFTQREFTVDAPGVYKFMGKSTGSSISVSDVFGDVGFFGNTRIVDYNWEGVVDLREVIDNGMSTTTTLKTIVLDLTDPDNMGMETVSLRTKDEQNNDVSYYIQPRILLDSTFFNVDDFNEAVGDPIPEGALGAMGSFDNPLEIEATVSAVPVPSALILFISGIIGLFGVLSPRRMA